MTTLDKDGVTVNAVGKQAQSQRHSAPSYGISKTGREHREKVFITEKMIKPNRLCREGPLGGAVYDLPSTLNPKPEIKMASGKRPDIWGTQKPEDIPSNDALFILPDSQPFRYPKQADILIGTEPRGKLNQAELMKAHAAAFFGRGSPGPAGVGGDYGPDFSVTKKRLGPARKFGVKITKPDWMQVSPMPPEVGPGRYTRKDSSLGAQHLTQRRNQSVHAFPRGPKFAKIRSADTISQLDAARTCFGKQPLGKNKTEPSINFNCDTRGSRDRTQVCRTDLDKGPVAFMPKMSFSMPALPTEKSIMIGGVG